MGLSGSTFHWPSTMNFICEENVATLRFGLWLINMYNIRCRYCVWLNELTWYFPGYSFSVKEETPFCAFFIFLCFQNHKTNLSRCEGLCFIRFFFFYRCKLTWVDQPSNEPVSKTSEAELGHTMDAVRSNRKALLAWSIFLCFSLTILCASLEEKQASQCERQLA